MRAPLEPSGHAALKGSGSSLLDRSELGAGQAALADNAEEIAAIGEPAAPRVLLTIAVPDFGTLTADVAGKSVRKAQAQIAEHGVDGVAVIVQGRLVSGNRIIEAGLVCLPRPPKPVAEIATSV